MGRPVNYSPIYASRFIYGINWFSIVPGYIILKHDLSLSSFYIGLLASSFFIGLMPFQFIGGILASKFGAKNISIIGLLLIGVFTVTCAIPISISTLIFSRILVGIGSAMFSSPALSIISGGSGDISNSGRIGLYNAAFGAGSGTGILGWTFLDSYLGYEISMLISGIIALAMIPGMLFIKSSSIFKDANINSGEIIKIVSEKRRWMLGLSVGIAALAEAIVGQLFIYYAEIDGIIGAYAAGLTVAVFFLSGIIGGIIWGRLMMRMDNHFLLFMSSGIISSLCFLMIAFVYKPYLLILIVIIMGIFSAGLLSIAYNMIFSISKNNSMLSFSLGFNNFIQKTIAIASPVVFIYIAVQYNYKYAWFIFGLIALAFLLLYPGIWERKKFSIKYTQ
ncbi:MAG: MFS transporter [Ferroplasma sp.]